MRTGGAAPHRVSSNQQQEVIPADGCGPVRVIMCGPKQFLFPLREEIVGLSRNGYVDSFIELSHS